MRYLGVFVGLILLSCTSPEPEEQKVFTEEDFHMEPLAPSAPPMPVLPQPAAKSTPQISCDSLSFLNAEKDGKGLSFQYRYLKFDWTPFVPDSLKPRSSENPNGRDLSKITWGDFGFEIKHVKIPLPSSITNPACYGVEKGNLVALKADSVILEVQYTRNHGTHYSGRLFQSNAPTTSAPFVFYDHGCTPNVQALILENQQLCVKGLEPKTLFIELNGEKFSTLIPNHLGRGILTDYFMANNKTYVVVNWPENEALCENYFSLYKLENGQIILVKEIAKDCDI